MNTQVAHQFDDAGQQFEAARIGMWVFLATEVLFFGGLFTGYAYYRMEYANAFTEGSRHLDLALGAINTAVLLLSSYAMALAVRSAQTNSHRASALFLAATLILGLVFLSIKGLEYYHKFTEHLVPGRGYSLAEVYDPSVHPDHVELFLGFYFTMTGLHAAHMVVGVGAVAVIAVLAWRGNYGRDYYTPVEVTGLYWHFVDIVWVFLFPLLYLIR